MEDTEAGFAYQDIFSGADHITRTSTSQARQSTSADPFGKTTLVNYRDNDDDADDEQIAFDLRPLEFHAPILFGLCCQRGSVRLDFDVIGVA